MIRRAAAAIVATTLATGIATAAFTGERAEPVSTVTAGTLDLTFAQEGTTVLDGAFLRPGQTRSQTVELKNAGTVAAGGVAIAADQHADTPPSAGLGMVLALVVDDCGADAACATPDQRYAGSLAAFTGATAGGIAAGGSRFVRVRLVWDATKNDPARQGASTSARLTWTAIAGASR
jgi:hypothetical protein